MIIGLFLVSSPVLPTTDICNGVKQGGVLSPILFCLYIDALFVRLKQSGIGCHIGNQYAGAVGYADDVSLIAPSRHAAILMLSICEKYAHEYDVVFNSSKSVLITYVTNWGKAGLGLRPARPTTAY